VTTQTTTGPLHGATALITGASSGIGEACAHALGDAGARLLLCARRVVRLERLAADLRARGIETHLFQLDVRDRAGVDEAIGTLPEAWRAIDILVNNAGLSRGLDAIQEGSLDDWEEMIDTNVKGLLYVTRAVVPGMIERGRGHVVNIGSIAGHEVYPKGNVYCGTKHAVRALTRGMQIDLNGTGVRVTTVDPGMVESEFSVVRFHGDQERAASVYKGVTPLAPSDVADAVVYCVTRPAHVNIHEMLLMPTDQATSTIVNRRNT
jgi:3-hydroxy acid dehydrogenase/malonic semialdehyde reductase